jgi:hypothetical protein
MLARGWPRGPPGNKHFVTGVSRRPSRPRVGDGCPDLAPATRARRGGSSLLAPSPVALAKATLVLRALILMASCHCLARAAPAMSPSQTLGRRTGISVRIVRPELTAPDGAGYPACPGLAPWRPLELS